MSDDDIVENDSCFSAHARYGVPCQRKTCKNWVDCKKNVNCVMVAAQDGPITLQEIGDMYGLTRMRICQIEKNICRKITLPVVK